MTEAPRVRPAVLLLEDEEELRKIIGTALGGEFEFFPAATAEAACGLLAARPFAAIVSDHKLPGVMQGLDFLRRAREVQPEARRILLTGLMDAELLAGCETVAPLSAWLAKPLHLERLRQALREALGPPQS